MHLSSSKTRRAVSLRAYSKMGAGSFAVAHPHIQGYHSILTLMSAHSPAPAVALAIMVFSTPGARQADAALVWFAIFFI